MAEFGLSIAAEDVEIVHLGDPILFLFLTCQVFEGDFEHGDMHANGWQTLEIGVPVFLGELLEDKVFEEAITMVLVNLFNSLPVVFLLLPSRQIIPA